MIDSDEAVEMGIQDDGRKEEEEEEKTRRKGRGGL